MATDNLERSDAGRCWVTHFNKFVNMLETALSIFFFRSEEEHTNKILFRTNNFVFEIFHDHPECTVERDLDTTRENNFCKVKKNDICAHTTFGNSIVFSPRRYPWGQTYFFGRQ